MEVGIIEIVGPPTITCHYSRVCNALAGIAQARQAWREGRIAYAYTLDAIIQRELDASRESADALGRLTLGELQHFNADAARYLAMAFTSWQRELREAL